MPRVAATGQWVADVLEALGYAGLVLLLVVENVFPPIPSEVVLPLAGFLASQGYLTLWGAIGAATLGSVLGAWILYALGRWGGRGLVLRYGHWLRVDAAALERAERWCARWGDWVVLGARVVPVARSVVSVPAGTMRMSPLRFTVLTAVGSCVWNTLLIGAGWLLGEHWASVTRAVEAYSTAVVVALAAGAAGLLALAWRRRLTRREG